MRLYLVLAILVGVLGVSFLVSRNLAKGLAPEPSPAPMTSVTTEETPLPEEASATPTTEPNPTVFYPVTDYANRITNRGYGKRITAANRIGLPCGDVFEGLHTGDDLEVIASEVNQEIPVFAIADGVIKSAKNVGGYGGLIVIEHQLEGQLVTTYYGHIDLEKSITELNRRVRAGEQISVLGDQCSDETSGERKHLHFSIRRGTAADVRGYVNTETELREWINPLEELKRLKAAEPTA